MGISSTTYYDTIFVSGSYNNVLFNDCKKIEMQDITNCTFLDCDFSSEIVYYNLKFSHFSDLVSNNHSA